MLIDLELPSSGDHQNNMEENRPCVTTSIYNSGVEEAVRSPRRTEHDEEYTDGARSGGRTVSKQKKCPENRVNVNSDKSLEPCDGMEFDSKDDAFTFYKDYAKFVGFSTITKASRRSRISGKFIDAKFVCTRYGKKRESTTSENREPVLDANDLRSIPIKPKRGRTNRSWSKTDCKACMHVKRKQDGRWTVRNFIKEHNHEIFPDQAYYFRGHCNIDLSNHNVDTSHATRERTKKVYISMSKQTGTKKKLKIKKDNILNASGQSLKLEEGDAQAMLELFLCMQEENPNFFYAIDLNSVQCLRNVFWVDAKGRLDYESFSDVVFFDTTYIKNEYKMPFAPFIGVNHHCQFLLLGCALMVDESSSTFAWEMRAWLRAMGGKAPKVILTDQDKALKEAVAEVFPDSRHCFCLWNVIALSTIQEKLGSVTRQHENFSAKFSKCVMKSGTKEQFERRWQKLVDRFYLSNDSWLQSLYEDRKRWAPAYMTGIFLGGISTLQRPESLNNFVDKFIQRKTTLKDFLDQYNSILQENCEEEAKADFETWHKQPGLKSPSPFSKQLATTYTHVIFKKFQVEVLGVVACHPKEESEDGATKTYKVKDFEENQNFIMVWNKITSEIYCSCHFFEYNGFLCRHVLIVLQMCGVHTIPSKYILKRWTKDAKSRRTLGEVEVVESRNQRYRNICQRAFKLGDEGSLSQVSYNIAFKALEEALEKCESVNSSIQSLLEPTSLSAQGLHDFEEVTQSNITKKKIKDNAVSRKGNVQPEPDTSMHEGWQQMEHLNGRVPTVDGYFGIQQLVQGLGEVNSMASNRNDYYTNQQGMQGLLQLNSIAPLHDGHFLSQQRLHELGQLHFRPQTMQGCFDMQQDLQDMDA